MDCQNAVAWQVFLLLFGILVGGVANLVVSWILRSLKGGSLTKAILAEIRQAARMANGIQQSVEQILREWSRGQLKSKRIFVIPTTVWKGAVSEIASCCPKNIPLMQEFYGSLLDFNGFSETLTSQTHRTWENEQQRAEREGFDSIEAWERETGKVVRNCAAEHNMKRLIAAGKLLAKFTDIRDLKDLEGLNEELLEVDSGIAEEAS